MLLAQPVLLRGTMHALLAVDAVRTFFQLHPTLYSLAHFLASLAFVLLVGITMFIRHRKALTLSTLPWNSWVNRRANWSMLIFIPLAAYYLWDLWQFIGVIEGLASVSTTGMRVELGYLHKSIWGRMTSDISPVGVGGMSLLTVVTPWFEEVVLGGLVGNMLIKRVGIIAAICTYPLLLAVLHMPTHGFGWHLLPLTWMGITFFAIRMVSGDVRTAVIAHVVINVLILLPKWLVAIAYFNHVV